ncbi:MAG: zinc-dependent metalloprotease, partial [Bacteroidota bacterium]
KAQMHSCGTSIQTQQEALERLSHNRAAFAHIATPRDEITYVPVQVHVVTESDGDGAAPLSEVIEMMCLLNDEFIPVDVQFYMVGPIRTFANDQVYSSPNTSAGTSAILSRKVNNAMNIFICGNIGSGPQGTVIQAYYQGPAFLNDFIVVNQTFLTDEGVVPHEAGHFFTLAHPFFGWESSSWTDAEFGGKPVGRLAPDRRTLNEKADSSNCALAADRICDTPPDYLFARVPGQGCGEFRGDALDPDSMAVDPMEVNMMSYFDNCRDWIFTDDQIEAMRSDLLFSNTRAYLRTNYIPKMDEIPNKVELISPAEDEVTEGYNIIPFKWRSVPGADLYILEVSEVVNFLTRTRQYVTSDTSFVIEEDFRRRRPHYWRVTPYHEGNFCVGPSETVSFRTGSGLVNVNEIDEVNTWSVRPNPLRSGQELLLQLHADRAFTADVQLYSLDGRLIHAVNGLRFNAGNNQQNLSFGALSGGLYMLSVRSVDGVLNKRVVVLGR